MFGFKSRYRRVQERRLASLEQTLAHVGMYDAERTSLSAIQNAENVLLRLVDERDAAREQLAEREQELAEIGAAGPVRSLLQMQRDMRTLLQYRLGDRLQTGDGEGVFASHLRAAFDQLDQELLDLHAALAVASAERDSWKVTAERVAESAGVRSLALERSARSAERVAYEDALRIAGREKGELVTKIAAAELELQQVFEVLVAHGYHADVADDTEINLPAAVCNALKSAEKVARAERHKVVVADVTRNGNPVVDRFDATHLSAKGAQVEAEWAAKAIEDFVADEAKVDQAALSLECIRAVADDDGIFGAVRAFDEFWKRGGETWLLIEVRHEVAARNDRSEVAVGDVYRGATFTLEFLGRGADDRTPTWRLRDA